MAFYIIFNSDNEIVNAFIASEMYLRHNIFIWIDFTKMSASISTLHP